MEKIEEQTLNRKCSGLSDLNEALGWIVRTYDQAFTEATLIQVGIQQMIVAATDEPDQWEYSWEAVIHGSFEVRRSPSDSLESA